MRLIGVTQQLAGVRRKTYGRVVLYEDEHSKMVLEHLGLFIKVKNTNVQKRGGSYNPWGLINRYIRYRISRIIGYTAVAPMTFVFFLCLILSKSIGNHRDSFSLVPATCRYVQDPISLVGC